MRRTRAQFFIFAAGGAVGTACHYITLIFLVEILAVPVVPATLAGFVVGALVNYVLARHFAFESSRPHRTALPRFAAVATVGAAINTVIVGSLFAAGLHYLVAQVAATAIVLAWNFLANKYWTFGA